MSTKRPGTPRPTAGRKPIYAERMVKGEVFAPSDLWEVALDLGDGNKSAGVRAALTLVQKGERDNGTLAYED